MDANGIMSVSAVETATGKEKRIRIENNKGALSKEDIERMVKESEQYHEADEVFLKQIEARNALEHYCYSLRTTVNDSKLKAKLGDDELTLIHDKIQGTLQWLEGNKEAPAEAYTAKQQDLQHQLDPIIAKLYSDAKAEQEDLHQMD